MGDSRPSESLSVLAVKHKYVMWQWILTVRPRLRETLHNDMLTMDNDESDADA